jgi:1-deoxy-D-xylulose-5-phosphate synthase
MTMSLLEGVNRPTDLHRIAPHDLPRLAEEIREFLIGKVCRTGGHLGANLGVVELTIALHRVFDSPHDRLLWDTGHQAYVHKVLTGRKAGFDRLRQRTGLSGYPSQAESEHDVIENSHASTALSYADGLARGHALQGDDRAVVAIIGDGALTGGLAWEALNNIGGADRPVIVVLNDNGRSYAPTVGGVADHLAALRRTGAARGEIFTEIGLDYMGPVDGHDISAVVQTLREARARRRPIVVHCVTEKGRGYAPAERDAAERMHVVRVVDPATGRPVRTEGATWTSAVVEELVVIASSRPDLVAITAAMPGPTGLQRFQDCYPDRFVDVGIAEQHAVAAAAGLALSGLHPVLAIYATFLNRAFDQVLMDLALHRYRATILLDRAGVTGEDGPSHNGMWDLSMLQVVPGLRIAAPRDVTTMRQLLREAVAWSDGPTVIRFPKGSPGADLPAVEERGGVDVLYRGPRDDVLIACSGPMAVVGIDVAGRLAGQDVGATVVDPRWVTPVNDEIVELAARHRFVITIEDNVRVGGFGCAVAQALRDAGVRAPVRDFGLPRQFLPHGSRDSVLADCKLTAKDIFATIEELLGSTSAGPMGAASTELGGDGATGKVSLGHG